MIHVFIGQVIAVKDNSFGVDVIDGKVLDSLLQLLLLVFHGAIAQKEL